MSALDSYNAILPQTQCRECGYPGCRPYAEALSSGLEKDFTRCLPGGQPIADALALQANSPLQTVVREPAEWTALVHLERCIGCNLCMKICPVDAFIGALNYEHQVIEEDCTGCQLCIPVCPTQCISIQPRSVPLPTREKNLKNIQRKEDTQNFVKAHKIRSHRASLASLLEKKIPPSSDQ